MSLLERLYGQWIDKTGRQLIIERHKHTFCLVSILDKNRMPFEIELPRNDKMKTTNLVARLTEDLDQNPVLEVEVGAVNSGPTYNLYLLSRRKSGDLKLANVNDEQVSLLIRPIIGGGLYGDYEDDLGVPWAYPLQDFVRKNDNGS